MSNGYVLGLDLGVTSVGWGIIDDKHTVVDSGVRLFEEANAADNETRREKRHARRVKRRRKQRVLEMHRHLMKNGFITPDFKTLDHPYAIRVKGLSEKLNHEELATALLHLAKRRGSTLDTVETDDKQAQKEELKAKETLSLNTKQLTQEQKHVCEIQFERLNKRGSVRGEDNIFKTEDYLNEARALLEKQECSSEFSSKALELIERKRHYSEGPGSKDSPSPYGQWQEDAEGNIVKVNLIEQMRGTCSIYKGELRAPAQSYSAELFNFLNDINNLKIADRPEEKLFEEEKEKLIEEIRKKGFLSPKAKPDKAIAKILNVDPSIISGFRTSKSKAPILTEFKGYQKFLKVFKNHEKTLEGKEPFLDNLSEVLTSYKKVSERKTAIKAFKDIPTDITENLIDDLSALPGFETYHSLSLKAIREINDEMLTTNKNQMEIITENNMVKPESPDKLTLGENLIMSPVAKRVQQESLKVIERLMNKYGDFDKIVIETTRAKNTQDEKNHIQDMQKRREQRKREVHDMLEDQYGEASTRLSGKQSLKVRLYKQQDGKCAYTYNPLDLSAIVHNTDTYEIDHVVPYSVSLDNSLNNKVLCEHKANQKKGNRTPYAYFKSGAAYGEITSFEAFKDLVATNAKYPRKKKELLLKEEDITRFDVLKEFTARNLVDTSYAIRHLMRTLKTFFKYHDKPTNVFAVRGELTNMYRGIATSEFSKAYPHADNNPLVKDRAEYRHHAVDALILARLAEQGHIRRMLKIDRSKTVDEDTGEILYDTTPVDDDAFRIFLKNLGDLSDEDIKFSWKVDKKPNRPFSDETIYSTRQTDQGEMLVKKHKDIYALEASKLNKFFGKDKEKLLVYNNDPKTFEKLEKAFAQYAHEKYPFSAYKEDHGPITKYSKNGNGPVIKSLKYLDSKVGNHMDISHNYLVEDKKVVLKQISPYRTDFYKNPDGSIKFLTIRRKDLKPINDKEYVIDKILYDQKKKDKGIKPASTFINSFNRNEIIEITSNNKGEVSKEKNRFIATNNDATKQIEVKAIDHINDKPQVMLTIGNKTIEIQKYSVSPIGEMQVVEEKQPKLKVSI